MGTRRKGRFVPLKITLPEDLSAQLDLMLLDTGTRRPTYGAKSTLITNLLRIWVKAQHEKKQKLQQEPI